MSRRPSWRPGRRLAWALLLGLAAAAVLLAAAIVYDGLTDERESADVAVVLGNQVLPSGQPSPRLRARLEAAAALYRARRVPTLLVSGARGKEGFDEAVVMRDYLVARGIPAGAVVVDSDGWTTGHSARNAAAWMRARGLSRAVVVSQYFHVSRSRLALRQCGISPVYGAHARFFEWRDAYSLPREVVGWLAYRRRGCAPAEAPAAGPPAADSSRSR